MQVARWLEASCGQGRHLFHLLQIDLCRRWGLLKSLSNGSEPRGSFWRLDGEVCRCAYPPCHMLTATSWLRMVALPRVICSPGSFNFRSDIRSFPPIWWSGVTLQHILSKITQLLVVGIESLLIWSKNVTSFICKADWFWHRVLVSSGRSIFQNLMWVCNYSHLDIQDRKSTRKFCSEPGLIIAMLQSAWKIYVAFFIWEECDCSIEKCF
jgi:hypothetical protein